MPHGKHGWRVVYGETRPAWEETFPTRRQAKIYALRCRSRGDLVFSVARVVPGEPPRSIMAAIDAAHALEAMG